MAPFDRNDGARPRGGFRMLAFDLDGTFLEPDGRLHETTARFLAKVRSGGIELVAATGRRLWSALPVLERLELDGSVVVHNGAMVARVPAATSERTWRIAPDVVREVVADLSRRGLSVLIFTDAPRGPAEVLAQDGGVDPTGYLAWYFHYAFGHFSLFPDLVGAPLEGVLRVAGHGPRGVLEEAARELPRRFPGVVRAFVQRENVMDAHRVELMAAGADKWSGVRWVAAQRSIAAGQILAVGDETNDIEMLAGTGWSLAAPGASDLARASAREVVADAETPALLRALGRVLDA